jgi:hypothetical protein
MISACFCVYENKAPPYDEAKVGFKSAFKKDERFFYESELYLAGSPGVSSYLTPKNNTFAAI